MNIVAKGYFGLFEFLTLIGVQSEALRAFLSLPHDPGPNWQHWEENKLLVERAGRWAVTSLRLPSVISDTSSATLLGG